MEGERVPAVPSPFDRSASAGGLVKLGWVAAVAVGLLFAGWVWWLREPSAFLLYPSEPGRSVVVVLGPVDDERPIHFEGRGRRMSVSQRATHGSAYRLPLPLGADLRGGFDVAYGGRRFRLGDASAPDLLGKPPEAAYESAGIVVDRVEWATDGRLSVTLREPAASDVTIEGLTSRYAREYGPWTERRSPFDPLVRFFLPDNLLVPGDRVDVTGRRGSGTWEEASFGPDATEVRFRRFSLPIVRGPGGAAVAGLPPDAALYAVVDDALVPLPRAKDGRTPLPGSSGRLRVRRELGSPTFRVRFVVPRRSGFGG